MTDRMNSGAKLLSVLAIGMVIALLAVPALAQVNTEIDKNLKPYGANGDHLSGKLPIGASESLEKLVEIWGQKFQDHHSAVKVETTLITYTDAQKAIEVGSQPIPEGAKMVALSHSLSQKELARIKAASGVEPIEIPIALDGIVIIVNSKNPIKGMTLDQVAMVFADKGSLPEKWSQIGVDGKLQDVHLNLYGREDTSGTFAAFQEMALKGAKQRKEVHPEPGSMSVVVEVGTDEAGIGYAATGHAGKSKRVKAIPLARKAGEPFILPTNDTVVSGENPLARYLYLYAMPNPDGRLDPVIKHFIAHVLSRNGQTVAHYEGFFPLPSSVTEQALRRIEHGSSVRSALTVPAK